MTMSVVVFGIIYKLIATNTTLLTSILIVPPILAYMLIPLAHTVWEKIYFRLYESGNNFFYIPSLSEVTVDDESQETVNVEAN